VVGRAHRPVTIVPTGGDRGQAGAAKTAEQRAAIGAPVVLAPSDAKRHDQIQYYRTVTTDQYGRFLLRNVVPGSYKLFAWEYIEDGAVLDSDFMKPVEEVGQPVLIQENSRTSARLKLIPADQSRRE